MYHRPRRWSVFSFVARTTHMLGGWVNHTENNKLYRKVKHRARPNISSRQRPKRAPIRRRSRRRQRRRPPHTEHGLGVLLIASLITPTLTQRRMKIDRRKSLGDLVTSGVFFFRACFFFGRRLFSSGGA